MHQTFKQVIRFIVGLIVILATVGILDWILKGV